jgi:hypothetical protein
MRNKKLNIFLHRALCAIPYRGIYAQRRWYYENEYMERCVCEHCYFQMKNYCNNSWVDYMGTQFKYGGKDF